MARRLHYHMLSGDHGYMPDQNEVYTTRGAALDAARDLAQEVRSEGNRVRGKRGDGYYECEGGGLEYIEVTECQEQDCLQDED